MKTYTPTDAELEAISLVKGEKKSWEEGIVWVTDKVGFTMRNVVKKARKNYFGIFDQEKDPTTHREKLFVPLTEWTVENVLKNIDIDTKDIEVRAKNPNAHTAARIFKYILRYYLDKANFGKLLNNILRNTTIDGTHFVKAWKESGEMKVRNIDRLNMIYDPSNIEDSSIIERNVLTLPEFKEYKWENSEYVVGQKGVDRIGGETMPISQVETEIPFVEVYERYGYMPKFCLTGEESDKTNYVYGVIVLSGLNGRPIIHKIKELKTHPYTVFKFKEVLNRGDGRGIPEMIFSTQAYLNEVVNIRLNTARVVQLGLWKAKGNITPQQVKKFFQTSVIKLDQSSEFERLDTGTVDPSSYKDEEQAYQWSQRVTQTQREDELAGSQPATNSIIEERGAAKGYDLVMENIKLSLVRLIEDKMIPIIKQLIKDGDIIRITGDPSDLQELDKALSEQLIYRKADEMKNQTGMYPFEAPEQMDSEIGRITGELQKMGTDRYVETTKKMFDFEFDIDVVIGDEQMNKALIMQGIDKAVGTLLSAGVPVSMLKDPLSEMYDAMGLDGDRLVGKIDEAEMMKQKQTQAMMEQQTQMGGPMMAPGAEANAMPKEANMMG